MSHTYRQPVGAQPSVPVAPSPLPGRMVAPICTSGPPSVFMSNAYGLLPQQTQQQYVAQPVVYPQSMQNVPNRVPFIAAVPPSVPRMFVPVASVPAGLNLSSPSTPDPAKLLEEQRRLEKERIFQMQQERLKQFTVSGKKSNINADNLIDSMFGRLQPKKSHANSLSTPPPKIDEISEDDQRPENPSFDVEKFFESSSIKPEISSNFIATSVPVIGSVKKEKKELDSMMLECSTNLNAPSKAVKFFKPSVKEVIPASSHKTTFTASEKARDWKNIQGLDEVFTAPKPRFPSWCHREKVPELYKNIQAIVTNNDQHAPDTNLLFPILVSSGLSRDLLGQIWEIVNESASGQLTIEEIYATLALIAVAQAGHPVKSVEILNQIPSCPIPQLRYSSSPSIPADGSSSSLVEEKPVLPTSQLNQHFHQVVRPTAIPIISNITKDEKDVTEVTENVATWTPFAGSLNTPDDEFDDFKSATPTAINYSLPTPSSQPPTIPDDDFDEFKQAPCVNASDKKALATVKLPDMSEMTKKMNEPVQQDLMSPEEDKYSVFRTLQDNSQWGDFTFSSVPNDSSSGFFNGKEADNKEKSCNSTYPSVLVTESPNNPLFMNTSNTDTERNTQEDDEFGDFIHASVTPVPVSSAVNDFADFSSFKSAESEPLPSVPIDDEFGEFTSSVSVSLKPELGQEFLFRHLKDNISLTESQSVSSLELGTFDGGGGHSGESKSSLSRQGSIPSLDLKSVGLDGTDSEDCFGEIQLSPFVPRSSKSPSPVSNTKGCDESESFSTPVGLLFQSSTLPLTDKYSVIRQEKAKEEDQHISCWTKCLQRAINILERTKKIFNQMSCSSVCNEVLTSEEGENYIKNVIEIYKVICRIGLASQVVGKQTEAVLDLINEADQVWNTICGFFAGSALMPEESSLDFSSSVLRPEPENNTKACGLCLLNIELRSKSFRQEEYLKLSYGGRNYHSTCANFWVNCVDPLLPALMLPQLL